MKMGNRYNLLNAKKCIKSGHSDNRKFRISKIWNSLLYCVVAFLLLCSISIAQSTDTVKKTFSLPTDEEIREILKDRIDIQQKSVGMVVGIITPQGKRIISYGRMNQGDTRQLNGETIFEIGSVTKIFTALLLSDMVQHGELTLSDPVEKYLKPGVKVPERNGRVITLIDLATHTSGLPFQPVDMAVGDIESYAKYNTAQLYKFLSSYKLENDIGSKWVYSNLGFGLLGIAIANRAGMDYAALVKTRITSPLGMKCTMIDFPSEMKINMAVGHDSKLNRAPDWLMPVFPGAGSLKSTANDILTLLAAFMKYQDTPLAAAMDEMLKTRRQGPNLQQALGWWVIPFGPEDEGIITFAGATFGFTTTLAYDPKLKVGVVVFSNSSENDGGLAWHLLRPAMPVETSAAKKAVSERKEISVDSKLFDQYIGNYQPKMGGIITIERQGDALIFKSPVVPNGLHLLAESAQKFFIKEADLQITFQTDSSGRATGIIVRFGGTEDIVPRIKDEHGKK